MTWGACFMYYQCPNCGCKFKYELGMIAEKGNDFGKCPVCNEMGMLKKEGAVVVDDKDYEEVY